MRKSTKRTILAFLIAPLMTPLFFGAYHLLYALFGPEYPIGFGFHPWIYAFIGVYAYLVTVVFGVPAFFIFRASGWTNVFSFVGVGAFIGFVVSLMTVYNGASLMESVFFTLAGALSAFVFRVILFGMTSKPYGAQAN